MKIRVHKYTIAILILLFIGSAIFLNIPVSTKQGVNFKVSIIKIPLYLKLINFMDRHYNYKHLIKGIISDTDSEQEKAMKIFAWTYKNIKRQPKELPVIDDHVWHIIIRGYGISDQFSDVFTTLCNYAGIDAFFNWIYTKDRSSKFVFSFVKINNRWYVFDPYRGIYFKNKNDEIADIEEIKSGAALTIESLAVKPDIDYTAYFDNLPSIENMGLTRASIQSPFKRFIFETHKWLKIK